MQKSNSLDLKSLIIGVLGTLLIISFFGFKGQQQSAPGRYFVNSSEEGIIILDTQTGRYIIDDRTSFNKTIWTKGDFQDSFDKGENRAASKRRRGN